MSSNVNGTSKGARWMPEEVPVETETEKLIRKSKKDPFIPIGFAGLIAACGYGAYSYKNRAPNMTTSRYLMRLRVIAQSCVVGAILVGVGYAALTEKDEKKTKH